MTRALEKAIKSWLQAERSTDAARAEMALRRVFLRLPLAAPPPDFARRVLARLGVPTAVPTPRPTLGWRLALGSCFALTAFAVATLPPFLADLWRGLGPGVLIDAGAELLVSLTGRLAAGITVWDALSKVAFTVSSLLTAPPMISALLTAMLLCVVASRWLYGLLIPERNSSYVQSN